MTALNEHQQRILLGLDGFVDQYPTSQGFGVLIGVGIIAECRALVAMGLLEERPVVTDFYDDLTPRMSHPSFRITPAGTEARKGQTPCP